MGEIENKKNYTLKYIVKKLASSKAEGPKDSSLAAPKFRDISEDDDGYHPYADVPDTRPLFEEDPWS